MASGIKSAELRDLGFRAVRSGAKGLRSTGFSGSLGSGFTVRSRVG